MQYIIVINIIYYIININIVINIDIIKPVISLRIWNIRIYTLHCLVSYTSYGISGRHLFISRGIRLMFVYILHIHKNNYYWQL